MPAAACDLLEREGELAQCGVLVDEACHGSGRLLLVEGSAGIGKTRLLAALCERARAAGMQVLCARGGELERDFPYGVARQLFEPTLARELEPEDLLAGAAALAAPLFRDSFLLSEPAASGAPSFATLHGLFWLAANLAARRPLALAVDDLHWADGPSLRWLAYLVRRLDGIAVLVAACHRPAEPGGDERLLAEVLSEPTAFAVQPAPLSQAAIGRLIAQTLAEEAEPSFRSACFEATGGNPFLAVQLLRALAREGVLPTAAHVPRVRDVGPRGIVRSVRNRLAGLPGQAGGLAAAVAVLGDDVAIGDAGRLACLDEPAAVGAAAVLSRVEILREGLPLGFVHPIVRAAVYGDLSPAERDRLHARAAALLEERGAAAEQVAAQLVARRPRGDAAVVAGLREAAGQALRKRAPDTAVAYLRRALDEPPLADQRPEVLYHLGAAERLILDAEAVGHLRAALDATSDPQRRGLIALDLGRMLFFGAGRGAEAIDVLAGAIHGLADGDADLRQRLEAVLLTVALEDPELYPRARTWLQRVRGRPPDDTVGGRNLLAVVAYHDARAGAPLAECLERAQRAEAGGLLYGDDGAMAWCQVGFVLTAADRFDAAMDVCDEALADARTRGSVFAFSLGCFLRGTVTLFRGALADAEADFRLAIEASESHGLGTRLPTPVARLADTLMERGDLRGAAAALERVAAGAGMPDTVHLTAFRDSRARLRLLQGRTREALAELLDLGRRYADLGGRNPAIYAWRWSASAALLQLGDHGEARRLAGEEVELARHWGTPRVLGRALRAAGMAEEGEDGLVLLGEAAAVLEDSPALLERARALVDLGAALRRRNRRAEAREPLRRGLELAHACGARSLAERAHTELLATGARPRRLVLSGLESLTPSERRVATMAAQGLTNRDLAQALFVTPRTVEVHLTSAYRKLGISARSQLTDALAMPVDAPVTAP